MSDVLVACPELLRARAAIALARLLVPDRGSGWTIATMVPRTASPNPLASRVASRTEGVLRLIAERDGAPEDSELRVLVGAGSACEWGAFCLAEHPGLAVIGPAPHRSLPSRLGAQLAARGGPAVATVPSHGAPPREIRRVGVLFSAAPGAEAALWHAAHLAAAHHGELRILAHPGGGLRRAAVARRAGSRDLELRRAGAALSAACEQLPSLPAASAVFACEPLVRVVADEVSRGLDVLVVPVAGRRARLRTARAIARLTSVAGCAVVTVPARPAGGEAVLAVDRRAATG
jgi:hypothetical protein